MTSTPAPGIVRARETTVRVAAYQAPLLAAGSRASLPLIRAKVAWCESEGVAILCCPEAIVGGLADHAADPAPFAIGRRRLDVLLSPLASDSVTTIVGFTELAPDGRLYNAAAVYHQGMVIGVYRKLHPALRRSIYAAGDTTPVFDVPGLTFGIVICNDSNHAEPARRMAAKGASALFVPTNNGLPPEKSSQKIVALARDADIARAVENRVWVIRADVAGRSDTLESFGSSEIVDRAGTVVQAARPSREDLIVAEIG